MDSETLYDDAVAYVRRRQDTSCAGLQRHLHIGYSVAKQLRERMERNGVFAGMEQHVEPECVVIKVVGVGGAGCNAVDDLLRKEPSLGIETIAINSDAQTLTRSAASKKVQLGASGLGGLGSSAIASDMARQARRAIEDALRGAHLVVIAAGMGGSTGAGGAPVVAQIAKELGVLCLGVAYAPWAIEGEQFHKSAETAMRTFASCADSVFVVQGPALDGEEGRLSLVDLLRSRDVIVYEIVDILARLFAGNGNMAPSFFELKQIMRQCGGAMIGSGYGAGPERMRIAIEAACTTLTERGADTRAASGLIIVVTMNRDSKLVRPTQIKEIVGRNFAADILITMGYVLDEAVRDEVRVTLIATGV